MRSSKLTLLAVSLLFIGVGCGARQTTTFDLPTVPPGSGAGVSVGVEADLAAPAKPYYVAFTNEQYRKAKEENRPILLYFWAVWCPICKVEEPKTRAIVETMDVPVAGFRVNFDTEDAMKKEFKVPYQHTTIILNTRGEESARFTGPVAEEDLRAAIRAAAK